MTVLEDAKKVLRIEANAILSFIERVGEDFEKAVDLIYRCKGKVVVTGIGKSGQICRKIAATLASTGTPAFFLHPAEGIHGDLGMIAKNDVVIAVSYSGNTDELLQILPSVKRIGAKIIALTGNQASHLAKTADVSMDLSVQEEACPMGLAPTASTTATLAMGDALAVSVLKRRNFSEKDFALFHPGGSLGRKLLLRVSDLMQSQKNVPIVRTVSDMKEAIVEISTKKLGATAVVDEDNALVGVITDGDLRRQLYQDPQMMQKKAGELMTPNPKTIEETELATKALNLMEKHKITSLFIVDKKSYPIGIIHLHDLVRAKLI
ncbi:MAG: D-arabinose 5-phosphate isomerase [Deltaproteobacteria bacterium RIFCSPHIGHO2_02_FULL_40_11]|nr:MAG: D-arabinose 5-phosphate isomerase [Deltaproteobacteria bacterium RIFCSPHIGHO2_02_FULL_40_11]